MRTCKRCKRRLPLDKFEEDKPNKFREICLFCRYKRRQELSRERGAGWKISTYLAREYANENKKFCPRCKIVKLKTEFPKSRNQTCGCGSHCLICARELIKLINLRPVNKEERHALYIQNKEKIKNGSLKRDFGITLEQYNKMLTKQNYACSICGCTQEENGKSLAVDHEHGSRKIRDLLCNNCNIAIGFLQEDPLRARKIADYLEKWHGLSVNK